MRSFRDLHLGTIPRQHPDRNLQALPCWVNHTDRAISPLWSAKDLQSNTMEWMKGVEDLNIRIIRAQGILGVGVTTHISTASFPPAVWLSITHGGSTRSRSSFYRLVYSKKYFGESSWMA